MYTTYWGKSSFFPLRTNIPILVAPVSVLSSSNIDLVPEEEEFVLAG
jgi:hypothetical protein